MEVVVVPSHVDPVNWPKVIFEVLVDLSNGERCQILSGKLSMGHGSQTGLGLILGEVLRLRENDMDGVIFDFVGAGYGLSHVGLHLLDRNCQNKQIQRT